VQAQLQEIERAQPKVGEDDSLEIEAKRLAHAEELGRLAGELGLQIQALPGQGEPNRLVVIVGADRATAG